MAETDYQIVALVPARTGSKRVPGKNVRHLAGHPLIAYTIKAALDSEIFDKVICATNSPEYAEIARAYGATVPFLRPEDTASDDAPDFAWVSWVLSELGSRGYHPSHFSILRPTNPFRTGAEIRRAWSEFVAGEPADSIRAVNLCSEHPAKMWRVSGGFMAPLLREAGGANPGHSMPYSTLPPVYVQNASLEIARSDVISEFGDISGRKIKAFESEGLLGFDINTENDWILAELLLERGLTKLPEIGENHG